jgi:hypothetical protein
MSHMPPEETHDMPMLPQTYKCALDLSSVFHSAIVGKVKTSSIHAGARLDLVEGKLCALRVNKRVVCVVRLQSVKVKQYMDITAIDTKGECPYAPLAQMWQDFYNREPQPEDLVTVIKWVYLDDATKPKLIKRAYSNAGILN